MARRKVRNYPSVDYMRTIINNYFADHREEVIADLLEKTGFSSLPELMHAERMCYFGLDCGFVYMVTYNAEQHREWVLDNGKYDAKVSRLEYPFNCQSVTCKEIELKKAMRDLELDSNYGVDIVLD